MTYQVFTPDYTALGKRNPDDRFPWYAVSMRPSWDLAATTADAALREAKEAGFPWRRLSGRPFNSITWSVK